MKTNFHGPMDCAKTMQLRFRVGDLDLTERRGTPAVEGKRKKMHRCALVQCSKAVERRTHIVGECETCKEERHVLKR